MKLLNINKSIFFIIFAWLIITSININKSFHIDDTAYLEIAKWIESNPLNPMSAEVNWGDKLQVNWEDKNINKWQSFHPPLFMYLIAFWGKIFSYDEVSLHILLSIFTFWVIFRFVSVKNVFLSFSTQNHAESARNFVKNSVSYTKLEKFNKKSSFPLLDFPLFYRASNQFVWRSLKPC